MNIDDDGFQLGRSFLSDGESGLEEDKLDEFDVRGGEAFREFSDNLENEFYVEELR